MNKLVEEIITPILEANPNIKKVVGIYGGRFQPFGPHHYKTYKWLAKQVDDAYITTSNIKKPPRHPMNFKEKVRHMTKMGIPSSKIVQEKSPYNALNLAKKYDKDTTAFVYVFGAKDAGRLGGKYFQDYKKSKGNIKGFEENGYYLTAPHVSVSVGGQEVSGTSMRNLLGSSDIDDSERAKLFKKMFGYYDKGLFTMMTNKFKKLFEQDDVMIFKPTKIKKIDKKKWHDGKDKELLRDEVTQSQLNQVEKYLDKLWGKVGIDVQFTRHFMDRVNDKRNDKPISSAEVIRIFKKEYQKYGKQISSLGKDAEALMKDMATDINVPFVLKWDGKEFDLIAKTIMRKKNFKSSNKKFAVEGVDLPIEIGDTVLMGKFKNKKVVVKTISWNEKGDLLINGKSAMRMRIPKKPNIFDEDVIKEFLTTIDMKQLIDEVSVSSGAPSDDGPNHGFGNFKTFKKRNKKETEKLGYHVVDYILKADTKTDKKYRIYPDYEGPIDSVTFFPAGDAEVLTPNNQRDLSGTKAMNAWKKHIKKLATTVGMKLIKYMDKDDEKIAKKDATKLLKQQKKEKDSLYKERVFSQDWWSDLITEQLLVEGGGFGHLSHIFEDMNLTFGDFKKIITLSLEGKLEKVQEKIDGMNIMISWRDGKLVAARSKKELAHKGKNAMTISQLKSKFKGRGEILNAFGFAMDDLNKSISSLSQKQKDSIFGNGSKFMNLEIVYPQASVTIPYGLNMLIFHATVEYDESGKPIGQSTGDAKKLSGMIRQINQHIQNTYSIGDNPILRLPKNQDFSKNQSKFLNKLKKLQSEFGLKDSDSILEYHRHWWINFIENKSKSLSYKISKVVLTGLVSRWGLSTKSAFTVGDIKKIDDDDFKNWAIDFEKTDYNRKFDLNIQKFENLILDLGVQTLKNVNQFLVTNPDKAIQSLQKGVSSAINTLNKSTDIKTLNVFKKYLERLNAIGGTDAIIPTEGIVFEYKGKLYKMTGSFTPIHRILNLLEHNTIGVKQLLPEQIKQVLTEGGNIPGVNSFIDLKYRDSTLKHTLKSVKLSKLKYKLVGNIRKSFMGDIDIAVNWEDMLKIIKTDKENFWIDLDKFFKGKSIKHYKIQKGLGQVSLVVPMVNNKGEVQSRVTDRKGTLDTNTDAFIQLDIMVGNVDWMKKSFTPSEDSKYKSVYKNIFLADILGQLIFKTKDGEVKRKLQINWREGLQLVDFTTTTSGKKKKIKVKNVTGDLDKFYRFLFGGGISHKSIQSFEELYKLFNSSKFHFPKQRKDIVKAYKNTLVKMKMDLPKEIK